MRCLRHITTAALLGLALTAAPAHAGDLAAAVRVANAVYPEVPQRCGAVRIEYGTLTPPNDTNGMWAEAHEEQCMVRIKPGVAESLSDARVCSLMAHEWGHLAGRRFPENTSDPYHSLDPTDTMHGRLVHHPACGESDEARATRRTREAQARITAPPDRNLRRADIRDEISQLKRQFRAAKRRAHGARRGRYARRLPRLRVKINRLRAEYRSLAGAAAL